MTIFLEISGQHDRQTDRWGNNQEEEDKLRYISSLWVLIKFVMLKFPENSFVVFSN